MVLSLFLDPISCCGRYTADANMSAADATLSSDANMRLIRGANEILPFSMRKFFDFPDYGSTTQDGNRVMSSDNDPWGQSGQTHYFISILLSTQERLAPTLAHSATSKLALFARLHLALSL